MDKQLFPENMSAKDKLDNLQAMAYSTEETSYFKVLTQEELDERRETLTENYIKISDLEAEKKQVTESIKAQQKPMQVQNMELLQTLKTKSEKIDGVLYHVDDQDKGMMYSYDANGDFISSRRLKPNERQGSMFKLNQISQ
jgi:glutamine synthetase type III